MEREKERIPCDICKRTFSTNFNMRNHYKEHHPDATPLPTQHTCTLCKRPRKIYKSSKCLQNHMRRIHKSHFGQKERNESINLQSETRQSLPRVSFEKEINERAVSDRLQVEHFTVNSSPTIDEVDSPDASSHNNYICPVCGQIELQSCNSSGEGTSKGYNDIFLCNRCGFKFSQKLQEKTAASSTSEICHPNNTQTQPRPVFLDQNTDFSLAPTSSRVKKPLTNKYVCPHCQAICMSRETFVRHIGDYHNSQIGGAIDENQLYTDLEGNIIPELRELYSIHKHEIFLDPYFGETHSEFNFPSENINITFDDIHRHLLEIFEKMNGEAFKINLSLGVILKHIKEMKFNYFHPLIQDPILLSPFVVSNRKQLDQLIEHLRILDIIEKAAERRPNTKWTFFRIANIQYFVDKIGYPMGTQILLPSYIKNRHCIVSFEYDHINKKNLLKDHKCLFRCLAFHNSGMKNSKSFERLTNEYFEKWIDYKLISKSKFKGVTLSQLPHFEDLFQVRICIYSLQENGCASSVYNSVAKYDSTLYMNLYKNHLSYIKDLNRYAMKFECKKCHKHFNHYSNWTRHQKSCKKGPKIIFPGSFFTSGLTLFERLERYGLHTEESDRYFGFLSTYDFESTLLNSPEVNVGDNTKLYREHRAVSVSVASNVLTQFCEHEPKQFCSHCQEIRSATCFVQRDPKQLVLDFVNHLKSIQNASSKYMHAKFSNIFKELTSRVEKLEMKLQMQLSTDNDDEEDDDDNDDQMVENNGAMEINSPPSPINPIFEKKVKKPNTFHVFVSNLCQRNEWKIDYHSSEEDDDDDDDNGQTEDKRNTECTEKFDDYSLQETNHMLKIHRALLNDLTEFCDVLPVIGFNSSRYDHQLIKKFLPQVLELAKEKKPFIVKKGNAYSCISTNKFKFLDLRSYIAPGYSYEKLLEAYNIEQKKSYFCYEWLNEFEKLDYDRLPPPEAFFSKLKGENTLGADDHTIASNYAQLQKVWTDNNMKTFKDFLIYYNNLDTYPLLQVCEKLLTFYRTLRVDMFKHCLSVSGISRRLIFQASEKKKCWFSLFGNKDSDKHKLLKNNICGGPSIVFCRYHKKNETFIKGNKNKICQSCQGFDANALYLYALAQPMPVGRYILRECSDNFIAKKPRDKFFSMFDYLDWEAHKRGIKIHHKMSSGYEQRIGPYFADGISEQEQGQGQGRQIIFEFNSCYFHGHDCELTRKVKNPKYHSHIRPKLAARTQKKTEFYKSRGYEVVEKYYCEWEQEKRDDPSIDLFLKDRWPTTFPHNKPLRNEDILNAVMNEKFFGLLEVDIFVPQSWPRIVQQRSDYEENFAQFTPKQYFSEMSPLFVSSEIDFHSIGEVMTNYAKKHNLSQRPRKLLVGGLKAEKILLASPLLAWYISHGLVVSKIYQTIEYGKKVAFDDFANMVTEGRLEGEKTGSKVKSDTFKLLGNSAYGSMLMDRQRFQDVKYLEGHDQARLMANEPLFRSMDELQEGLYEVQMAKRRITENLPVQIGFFILQYAKLRMLEFHFDFLMKYFDPDSFEPCQMDTDSEYIAIAAPSIEHIFKNSKMRDAYHQAVYGSCNDTPYLPNSTNHFLTRKCCSHHISEDRVLKGAFKFEFSGSCIVALCSKCWACEDADAEKTKFSSKGLNKRSVEGKAKENRLSIVELYKKVLDTGVSDSVVNTGFRTFNNVMMTFSQKRTGLSFFYIKRVVQENGISTRPLDITLRPYKSIKE